MSGDLLAMALIAGVFTWAFRVLPTRMRLGRIPAAGPLRRFLGATGPAAIATLFVASVLPDVAGAAPGRLLPMGAGVVGVLALWLLRRSVVLSCLGGALVCGLVAGLLAQG